MNVGEVVVFAAAALLLLSGGCAMLGHTGIAPATRDCELLRFLRNLAAQHQSPGVHIERCFSYLYTAKIYFKNAGVRVELEYNRIRDEWDLEVYAKGQMIYGEMVEPIGPFKRHPPQEAVDFLLDAYELRERIERAASADAERHRQRKAAANATRKTILGAAATR